VRRRLVFPIIACFSISALSIARSLGPSSAQVSVLLETTAIEKQVNDYLQTEMRTDSVPGLSIAVVRAGKVVFAAGFGMGDVENKKPALPETAYEIGSITKQFTATATMMLVEEGKIHLDDPVTEYIRGAPDAWKRITIRNLLTHTSGIAEHTKIPELEEKRKREFLDPEEVVNVVGAKPLQFQPGERHVYCNTNYFLLGLIITRVVGSPYSQFMSGRIFTPLGMRSTRLTDGKGAPDLAQGYRSKGGKADYIRSTSEGGIISTVLDLAKWITAYQSGRVLKKQTIEQMWTPLTLNDGRRVGYGFGWIVNIDKTTGNTVIEHGGFTHGFSNFLSLLPSEQLAVIVLTNSDKGYTRFYSRGVAAIYAPWLKEYWARDELDFREKQNKKH
jgi:CubicO group peptidase (beta-lactamase class C family)